MRRFFDTFTGNKKFNTDDFAELITSQDFIGALITEEDDDDPFGLISIIPLKTYEGRNSVQQVKSFILSKVPNDNRALWEDALNSNTTGLLVNERLINIPNLIAPQLNASIFDDLVYAKEDGFDIPEFDRFIYMTEFSHADIGEGEKSQSKRRKLSKTTGHENKTFWKAEDEIYLKHSDHHFTTEVTHSTTRLIVLFSSSAIPQILSEIEAVVHEGYNW
eukprot:TRINITY_DN4267_c0_g1_i2.p1 TRINITY_DN4267_c0_g1~~TRINITY_DN4267_c0_g1_i2.p1  ORF type:complete len:219 (+),score=54.09 TRINITY_DN4267_c0_g1_i2:401-1057(+)